MRDPGQYNYNEQKSCQNSTASFQQMLNYKLHDFIVNREILTKSKPQMTCINQQYLQFHS
jgi:hypothetical protein